MAFIVQVIIGVIVAFAGGILTFSGVTTSESTLKIGDIIEISTETPGIILIIVGIYFVLIASREYVKTGNLQKTSLELGKKNDKLDITENNLNSTKLELRDAEGVINIAAQQNVVNNIQVLRTVKDAAESEDIIKIEKRPTNDKTLYEGNEPQIEEQIREWYSILRDS